MEILPEVLKWPGCGGKVPCVVDAFLLFLSFSFIFWGGLGVIYYSETLNFLGASGCLFLVLLFLEIKIALYLFTLDGRVSMWA